MMVWVDANIFFGNLHCKLPCNHMDVALSLFLLFLNNWAFEIFLCIIRDVRKLYFVFVIYLRTCFLMEILVNEL